MSKLKFGEWYPIEMAPKDCELLVCDTDGRIEIATLASELGDSWIIRDDERADQICPGVFTHFMPLPTAPTSRQS